MPRAGAPLLIETGKRLPRNLYFQTLKLVPLSKLIKHHDQRRVCGWLSVVVHAPKGTRNDRLFWAACRFGEFIFEGRLRSEIAERLLYNGAEACGLVKDDGQQSVMATIVSGLRAGSASNGARAPDFDESAGCLFGCSVRPLN
jgi:hypothetical protein